MSNSLLNIDGYNHKELPFTSKKVGDLSYFDGSLLSVFESEHKEPVIYNWAEFKKGINRWIVLQVSRRILAEYIYGRITHLQLLKSPQKDIVFIVDVGKFGVEAAYSITQTKIPDKYLPDNQMKFKEEDSIGLQRIIDAFDLSNIRIY